jgi:hypothetical protein
MCFRWCSSNDMTSPDERSKCTHAASRHGLDHKARESLRNLVGSHYNQQPRSLMWPLIISTICAGIFAGAAIYINVVEHPARLSCGNEIALRQFAPSYHRATVMQASLAVMGCLSGLWSAWLLRDAWIAVGAVLLGSVVPFTLIVILPTNKQLLDTSLDRSGVRATGLLVRWGRLHAIQSLLSSVAFVLLLLRLSIC